MKIHNQDFEPKKIENEISKDYIQKTKLEKTEAIQNDENLENLSLKREMNYDLLKSRVENAQGIFNSEESLRSRGKEMNFEEAKDLEELTVLRMQLEPSVTIVAQSNISSESASHLLEG
jgi:hypothetical protein